MIMMMMTTIMTIPPSPTFLLLVIAIATELMWWWPAGIAALCPDYCVCKWKNGKQTVECISRDLYEIPSDLDTATQVLDVTNNTLQRLVDELFITKQLINLQRINLAQCRIEQIDGGAFQGLTNLVELDLTHNLLRSVPFFSCPSLMRLTLNTNPITILKRHSFRNLSFLTKLELSNCQLEVIEDEALQGLYSLEWLYVDGNRLRTLESVQRTLPATLKGVDLHDNLWECNCHLQEMWEWLQWQNRTPLSVEPQCHSPERLQGRVLKLVTQSELACLPEITPTTFFLELPESKNVSILCYVHAVPDAVVFWWFQDQILQNNTLIAPGLRLIYYVLNEPINGNQISELFIYQTTSTNSDQHHDENENATFICNAENPAGLTQSNFTIKMLLKRDESGGESSEPIVIIVSFPLEYLLAAAGGVAVFAIVTLIVLVIIVIRCHRKRRRQQLEKRKSNDKATIEIIDGVGGGRSTTIEDDKVIRLEAVDSTTSTEIISDTPISTDVELISVIGPSPRRLHPDIINGITDRCTPPLKPVAPLDYQNFYRTLPYNKQRRMPNALHLPATIRRYAQDAEFLSPQWNQMPTSQYDYQSYAYSTDIRYTADGYPVRTENSIILPSTCCSCIPPPTDTSSDNSCCNIRCIGAQSDKNHSSTTKKNPATAEFQQEEQHSDVLTESPDEGYEGEPPIST